MAERRGGLGLVALAVAVGSALLVALVVAVAYFASPPMGEPIAEASIESGVPFELSYASDGAAQRVFLELECERCSLPVQGALTARRGDEVLASAQIDAGEDALGTNHEHLDARPVLEIPATPRGTTVTVRGTLTVHRERGALVNEPLEDAPDPIVHRLRVTVAASPSGALALRARSRTAAGASPRRTPPGVRGTARTGRPSRSGSARSTGRDATRSRGR